MKRVTPIGYLLAGCLAIGCGKVSGAADAAIDTPPTPLTFKVAGTVTGFAGSGLTLRLNGGNDLAITADGAFSFPVDLADGASYGVTIAAAPTCPQRLCTLASATGLIAGGNASVTVTCTVPRYRLASNNWGSPAGIWWQPARLGSPFPSTR
jgi:hypothetical protein